MKLEWILWLASLLPQPLADHTCLATTVYLEARSEPTLGQMAVAEVAMRRWHTGRWGDTVCAVVNAKGQFAQSLVSKQYRLKNADAWQKAWGIAADSLHNWSLPPEQRKLVVPDADHFYAQDIASPAWGNQRLVAVIGGHSFISVN
ncbi:MAG: cell wall hydrolase [Xanthomonadales bacterium]|nr:cell wall hydrolase [Xanthomonadales bacterium]